MTEEKIKHFLYRFRVLDMSKEKNRRILIDMFINRIYLYDDKLVITFNHKDGAETITLEDVETALAEAGFGSDLVSFAVPIKDGVNDTFTPSFILSWRKGLEQFNLTVRWTVSRDGSTERNLNFHSHRNENADESLPVYPRASGFERKICPSILLIEKWFFA